MSNSEAAALLTVEIGKYRLKPYAQLAALVGDEDHPAFEIVGGSGRTYWLEIEVFLDSPAVVRVRGAICGGGIDYQVPLCDDFLKASDESFVDEPSSPAG